MDKKALLDLTDDLRRKPELWEYSTDRVRVTARVDGYTVHCERRPDDAQFQVEHERFGILVPWRIVRSVTVAKLDALDYVRACIIGEREHVEA